MLRSSARITTFFIAMITATLLLCMPATAQHQHHLHDDQPVRPDTHIGEVNFGVACDESVQPEFDEALGMMHHMMYVAARSAFEGIIEDDPDCAMAYWGVATTLFQPLWGTRPSEEDLNRGWELISQASELAGSSREQKLIASTAGFFRDPETADFRTRIQRWADGVSEAYEAYPDDADVASLYGLTLMTRAQFMEDRKPLFDEAEAVLRRVFEKIPTHPGAIHYSIHATDVDGRAENALDMVEMYAHIAPQVPHALHMPSHIYVRLGDWPQVIDWNMQSADAALKFPVNGAESHHYIHAIDYLVYAYLQRGEDDKAGEAWNRVLRKDRHQASFISAFHYAAIPARLAVERRDWEGAASLEPRTPEYLPWDASPWAESLTWYARGLGAVHTGDMNGAADAEQRLGELRDIARDRGDDNMVVYIEADRLVLAGRIALSDGQTDRAVELTREAVQLETTVEKHPVTPGALQPPREALGNLFMDLGRPDEALAAYKASDEIWPGRLNTLMGAAVAARLNGSDDEARRFFARLLNSAAGADFMPIGSVHEQAGH
jgi:tetratricopeptide (TPR) repeat protein